jgi:molecular chaperone GrpE (heat shock protein)
MSDRSVPRASKWPFVVGDLLLLGVGVLLFWQAQRPMVLWEAALMTLAVGLGAVVGIWPFLLEYQAALRLAEAQQLNQAVLELENVQGLVRQINSASAQWVTVQEAAGQAVQAAKEIGQTMAAEARAFQGFLQKANDAEKSHLRLEVEKLRRAEGDWLQVLIRTLDNVYTLFHAAERGRDPNLVNELGSFQRACYDAARWVGLMPLLPRLGDAYDSKLHQHAGGPGAVLPPNPCVEEVIAAGYRFQGQLVRPSLVRLRSAEATRPAELPAETPGVGELATGGPVESASEPASPTMGIEATEQVSADTVQAEGASAAVEESPEAGPAATKEQEELGL